MGMTTIFKREIGDILVALGRRVDRFADTVYAEGYRDALSDMATALNQEKVLPRLADDDATRRRR